MRRSSIWTCIAGVLVAACGTSTTHVRGPNGEERIHLKCKYEADCLETAGDECGRRGYLVLDQGEEKGGYVTSGAVVPARTWRTMLIQCK
jgi:hypothetical protein